MFSPRLRQLLFPILMGAALASAALACDGGRRQPPEAPTAAPLTSAPQEQPAEAPALLPTESPATQRPDEAPTEAPATQQPDEAPTEAPPTEVIEEPTVEPDPLGDQIESKLDQLFSMNESADPLDDLP